MSRIVLDAATIARLLEDPRPREVCDEQGTVVGYFQPKLDSETAAPAPVPQDEEEERQRQTAAEVIERIHNLEGE